MAWLVEHVTDLITKYLQGADGKTAYQRLLGTEVHEEALEFGERVMYKTRRTNEYNVVIDARWVPGVWLGRSWGTICHRVWTDNLKACEARAVQRIRSDERWSREYIEGIRITP